MEKRKSKLFDFIKGSAILVISNIILKAVNFFLLPLYTQYLTPDLLGVSDMITNFTSLLFTLLVLALDSAFGAFYYDEEKADHQDKLFNTVWLTMFVASIVPILLMLGAPLISRVLFETDTYSMAIVIALASVSVNLWFLPFALRVRMQNRMTVFAVINIVSSFCMVAMNIVFLSVLDFGYYTLIVSVALTHLLQFVLYFLLGKTRIRIRLFNKELLFSLLRYSMPLIPVALANWIVTLSDRYILLFCGYSEGDVGIYGVAARFVMVLTVLINAVFIAYPAYAFRSFKDEAGKRQFPKVLNAFFLMLAGVCFTIALFGQELITLMTTPSYYSAYKLLPDLMFAQLAYGLSVIIGYGITFLKKSVFTSISFWVSAAVNIITNLIFIPRYGLSAAVATTFASYCIMLALNYIFAQRLYPCRYEMARIIPVMAGLYIVSRLFVNDSVGLKLLIWEAAAAISLVVFRKDVVWIAVNGWHKIRTLWKGSEKKKIN